MNPGIYVILFFLGLLYLFIGAIWVSENMFHRTRKWNLTWIELLFIILFLPIIITMGLMFLVAAICAAIYCLLDIPIKKG